MINKPFLSIIIPVYNAEKFLKQCLNSILKQNFNDCEIICIDDNSNDNSYEILKKFAKQDNRFKIYRNPQNIGAGLTRNIGVEKSSGDYIFFLDSDDWLEKNSLKILVNLLQNNENVDFIQYGISYKHPLFKFTLATLTFPNKHINKILNIKSNDSVLELLDFKVNKVINSHFLKSNNIIFNNNKTLEDVEFTLKLIKYAKNFFLINDKIYNYRISVKDSVSSKIPEKHNYNVDFIKYANHCLLEYNKQTQINVFNNLYKLFLQNLTSSYFYKKINYQELKNIVLTNIDYDIMNEKQSKYFFDLYESINMDSEEIFRKKYYIKFLLKKYFFCGFLLYRSLKTFLFKICYNR